MIESENYGNWFKFLRYNDIFFRLTPVGHSCLSPIPDGWQLQNKMVGLILWVSELWPVVTELLYILQCTVPCRCSKVAIWKIPIWCLTFLVYPRCVLHQRADHIYGSPFYLHSDGWALQAPHHVPGPAALLRPCCDKTRQSKDFCLSELYNVELVVIY